MPSVLMTCNGRFNGSELGAAMTVMERGGSGLRGMSAVGDARLVAGWARRSSTDGAVRRWMEVVWALRSTAELEVMVAAARVGAGGGAADAGQLGL
ncbi:hypothetical protein M0R45_007819 [Rubus argutus]|uniref:Uncharacterized protein n=1 Tax=Rubus argutus TaxID=59490 RepID=A0AAW1XZA2_RUBAR